MTTKEPVVLVVLVDTSQLRWFVAGVDLQGVPIPLMMSEADDLSCYQDLEFDEQVSFLRHRLSGVLQRGCDRLWARQKKPCQVVFLFDGLLDRNNQPLTRRVAEHFVDWLSSPPVAAFTSTSHLQSAELPELDKLEGELEPLLQQSLQAGLGGLIAAMQNSSCWELSPKKKR